MAKKSPSTTTKSSPPAFDQGRDAEQLYRESYDALGALRPRWDDAEAMHISQSRSKLDQQKATISTVNDGRLATMAFEGSARVMAQFPTGRFMPLDTKDKGKSALMQVTWDRYVVPNARAQFDLLTKYRLWDLYSKVYGSMPMLYDWRMDDDYVGPDCWLVPIRSFFPQPGKTSIQDSDWLIISTLRSVHWLKSRKGMDGWKDGGLSHVIEEASHGPDQTSRIDQGRTSFIERNRTPSLPQGRGDNAQVELVTLYESGKKGHWVTYCPDFDWAIIRDIANPHDNGQIPVILKHCFPLLDSMIGLGDYERGKTLQYARNSLLNMALDQAKMALYPPLLINDKEVSVPSSIQWSPAAQWQVKRPEAITPLATSSQWLATFQSTWDVLTAALQNLQGTTDTTTTAATDPTFGKTPAALQLQAGREASRDNWNRFFMEQSIECLTGRMANLFARNHASNVQVPLLFPEEIKRLREAYPDEQDLVSVFDSEQYGQVTVKPEHVQGTYLFNIDASSTLKREQATQHQATSELITLIVQSSPVLMPLLQQEGYQLNVAELLKQSIITSGLDDHEKILQKSDATQASQGPKTPDGMPQIPGVNAPGGFTPGPLPHQQPQNNYQDPAVRQAAQQTLGGLHP